MSKEKNAPLVVIRCITYNQEKYIGQTLAGFVNQKTNFPFVAIVHDDASTDKTAVIIKEYEEKYPGIIKPIYDKINRHKERTLGKVMDDAISKYDAKYIAWCEGDDYWIDPYKLQKQVDYMEDHPECVMCHTDSYMSNGENGHTKKHHDDEPYFGPGRIHEYPIYPLTTLYRKDAYDKTPKYSQQNNWLMGDLPLWIELSRLGKFHYMDIKTSMYRVLQNSASHSTNPEKIIAMWQSGNDIVKFYSELYGYSYSQRSKSTLYLRIMKETYSNRDKDNARKYWGKAKDEHECNLKIFLFYVCNIYNFRWLINLIYKVGRLIR